MPAGGHSPAVKPGGGEGSGRTGTWKAHDLRVMSLTRKTSMTNRSPEKTCLVLFSPLPFPGNLPGSTPTLHVRVLASNPPPNLTKSDSLFSRKLRQTVEKFLVQ
jgi:hypothetical protein